MRSFFSPDSALFRIVDRLTDLIVLNFLYIIFCIPIVTIGPATVALRYVTLKYAANEEDRVWAPFIHSFKQNLKQGIALGLITTLLGVFLALDMYWIYNIATTGDVFYLFILVIVAIACILYLMMTAYIYPLMARYDNSLKQMFRTAVVLAIRHLPATACVAVIAAAPIVLLFYTLTTFALSLAFYSIIGFATIALLQDKLIHRIFLQYSPKDTTEE